MKLFDGKGNSFKAPSEKELAIGSIGIEYNRVNSASYFLCRIPKESISGKRIVPKVALTSLYGDVSGAKVSALSFAKREKSIFTMNASLFNMTTMIPQGQTIVNGVSVTNSPMLDDNGTAISDAECYPLCIDGNGALSAPYGRNVDTSQMIAEGVKHSVVGWGTLVDNFKKTDSTVFNEIVHPVKYVQQVIGQYADGDYCVLTVNMERNGRAENDAGMTYAEMADVLIEKGVKFAYVLDGGGSSETVIGERQINAVYEGTSGRAVPTVIYFDIEE